MYVVPTICSYNMLTSVCRGHELAVNMCAQYSAQKSQIELTRDTCITDMI